MRRKAVAAAAWALISSACLGRTVVENTPPPTTQPAAPLPMTLVPTPEPTAAPADPRPRPGPNQPPAPLPPGGPPGGSCGVLSVRLGQPRNGQNLTASPVGVEANVGSGVNRVDFYYHIDSRSLAPRSDPPVLIGRRNGAPFRVDWSLPRECNASTSVLAVAYDGCGNAMESDVARVNICYR